MLQRNMSNRWANVAQSVDIPRSQMSESFKWHTTGNVGKLYPMCPPIEVLPGDGFMMKTAQLARLQTPLVPVMDTAYIDTFWFFVPMRLTWEHSKNFFGESEVAGFQQLTSYAVPSISAPSGGFAEKSLADYFGIPTKVDGIEVSALQGRAYRLIWNNFFRDQNLQNVMPVNLGDDETMAVYGEPLPVNKFHDYFTSALPYPQKGPDVLLPLSGNARVYTQASDDPESLQMSYNDLYGNVSVQYGFTGGAGDTYVGVSYNSGSSTQDGSFLYTNLTSDTGGDHTPLPAPVNLFADLQNVNSATIIQLRQAFAVQRLYENFALHGSRYYEMLRGSFGVIAPEASIQIPEYLGGARQKVNMTQVIQTSSTSGSQALGSTGAFSLTTVYNQDFDKSFVEHGWLIGLYCVRTNNSYQQGLARQWSRRDMLDFYFPELANIGEQPVYNREIYAQGTEVDDQIFGYQERYAEYRYFPSGVSGEFRSNSEQSLDVYHYADDYSALPILSDSWIRSSPANMDRTLTVSSDQTDQFFCDFDISFVMRRKMPLFGGHSIAGWM